MSELDVSQQVQKNTLAANVTLLTVTTAVDLIASVVAKVAGNDIADTLNGSPLVGDTLDSVVAARLNRLMSLRTSKLSTGSNSDTYETVSRG